MRSPTTPTRTGCNAICAANGLDGSAAPILRVRTTGRLTRTARRSTCSSTSTAAHGFSEQRREQLKQRVDAGELVPLGPDRPPTPRERVAGPQRMPHWRSLAARRPDLAAQTRPATASSAPSTSPCTQRRPCGGSAGAAATQASNPEGSASPAAGLVPRVRRTPGPTATGQPTRSLAARPDLLAELHPTLNPGVDLTRVAAKSHKKLWWQCPTCGHSWQTTPAVRAGGSGCPQCALESNRQTAHVVEAAHSLAIKHPDIAAELHATRNPGIDPSKLGARSGLRLWWRCPDCGHEW